MEEQDYRIHITVRRRGEPVFTSNEIKTEQFNDMEQLLLEIMSWTQCTLDEDLDYLSERENDE